jgi:long-chain fatty acid transport protein
MISPPRTVGQKREKAMRSWSATTIGVVLALPLSAGAAGFQTLEQGTNDMGRAMVGMAAIADSAATAWFNPAGMTELEQPNAVGGIMGIFGHARFRDDGGTTVPGTGSGDILDNAAAPGGLFYTHPVNERLVGGFSVTAPFVGTLDYDDNWVGRYIIREFDFTAFALTGSAAYKLTDKLSVGAQVMAVYANMDFKVAIQGMAGAGDGGVHIDDADGWEPSFGLGLAYQPWEHTRIGLTYKYEVDLEDLDGNIRLNLPAGIALANDVEVGFTLPSNAALDVMHQFNDKLTLFAGGGWADFSEFDLISIDLSLGGGGQIPTGFRDAYAFGLAGAYQLRPDWTLQTGWSWASSPVKKSKRSPMLPFDRQIRYGLGVIHQVNESLEVGLNYTYLDAGSAKFNQTTGAGTVSGKFRSNEIQMVALTVSKTF